MTTPFAKVIEGHIPSSLGKEVSPMRNALRIKVSQKMDSGGIVSCREKKIKKWLMNWLFGQSEKVTILVPGCDVAEVQIVDLDKNCCNEEYAQEA